MRRIVVGADQGIQLGRHGLRREDRRGVFFRVDEPAAPGPRGGRRHQAGQNGEVEGRVQAAEDRTQAAQREKEAAEGQIAALNQERDAVRQRVEKMLQQMDELL